MKEQTPYFDFEEVENEIKDLIIDKVEAFMDLDDEQYQRLETLVDKHELGDIIQQFISQINYKLKTSNIL